MNNDILYIRLPDKLKEKLKSYADSKGMSVSEAVRYIIRKEIEN